MSMRWGAGGTEGGFMCAGFPSGLKKGLWGRVLVMVAQCWACPLRVRMVHLNVVNVALRVLYDKTQYKACVSVCTSWCGHGLSSSWVAANESACRVCCKRLLFDLLRNWQPVSTGLGSLPVPVLTCERRFPSPPDTCCHRPYL